MRRLLSGRAIPVAAVVVGVLLASGGGFALASGGGTIHACVHKHGGGLYLGTCAKHDHALSWDVQGRQGATGATGATGPQGPQGNQGLPGNPGPAGTARGYAVVSPTGVLVPTQSHNVVSVTNSAPGEYCVELAAGIAATQTPAVVSPYYPLDTTDATQVAHVEYEGNCGTNGKAVWTFNVTDSGTFCDALHNQSFSIIVP